MTSRTCLTATMAAVLLSGCSSGADTTPGELVAGSTLTVASSDGTATGHVRAESSEIAEGPNVFLVDFDPADTELLSVSALMPVHGHGTPAPPSVARTASGYRVANVLLNMGGLWDVFLDVRVASSSRIEFTVDVP